MKDNFDISIQFIFDSEGGYVDHPKDPGGCTNMGITLATLRGWRQSKTTCNDVKRMSKSLASMIYEKNYWNSVKGDDLPSGIDLCVFDHGVNAGPRRAIRLLQGLVGVDTDGMIGPITLKAAADFDAVEADFISLYSNARREYYRGLSTFKYFGKGWLNRVDKCERLAIDLADSSIMPAPKPEPEPEPEPEITLESLARRIKFLEDLMS